MNSGYVMIDFTGISSGTNPELAKQITDAIASGKLIVGYGINGRSPVVLSTIGEDELVGNGVDITVAENAVVISNLLPNTVKITLQPQDATAAEGSSVTFSVTATGASTLSYQWYSRTSDSGAWSKSSFVGNKTATLTVSATSARNGYQYCCIISDAYSSVVTNPVTLTVTEASNSRPGGDTESEETVKKIRK